AAAKSQATEAKTAKAQAAEAQTAAKPQTANAETTKLETAKGLWATDVQTQAGCSPEDTQGLVDHALVKGIRYGSNQVGYRIDSDDLFRNRASAGGDFDVIPADQVGAVDLPGQEPEDRAEADIGHLGQADRQFFDVIHAILLKRWNVDQDGDIVAVGQELQGVLEGRILIDCLLETDRPGQLFPDAADALNGCRVIIGEAA